MISYQPLFETMKKMNISSYELAKRGFSRSSLSTHRTMEQLHSEMKKIKR